jgi:hypothetical protein
MHSPAGRTCVWATLAPSGSGFTIGQIGAIMSHARPSAKITLADMRDMGVRGVLIYCADFPRRSHRKLIAI